MNLLLSGNEAIARGAYEYGITFASGYPGTPSTEILENIVKYQNIRAQWCPNEKVALEVAAGAALGGARSIATMKHVGLNVAADPLFGLSYSGVNAGLIIVSADDPGMHSSQDEQDNRWFAKAAKIPMFEPSDSQESKDYLKAALEISEKYDTPVLFRMTTRICHSKTIVSVSEPIQIQKKNYSKDFNKNVLLPSNAKIRHTFVEKRMLEIETLNNSASFNTFELRDEKIGIITSGIAYQYAKEIFPNASFLKLGMTNPLPRNLILDFASKVKDIIVIEELDPYLEDQIKALGIKVTGKDKLPIEGEFNLDIIERTFFNVEKKEIEKIEIQNRPPTLCPGCSHRGMFYVFKKLHLNVTGDIGCYTLGALPPLKAMDTCLCMGAGVSMAFGMEEASNKMSAKKTIGVIGDSTFVHSGITGLINIVYNQGITTICILDNHITAMTGHQENPVSGKLLTGKEIPKLDLVKLCEAIGVKRVKLVNPFNIEETEAIVSEELETNEPSVIISSVPCLLHDKLQFDGTFTIDKEKCPKCGVCIQLGCSAIGVDSNGYPYIDPMLCPGCTLCKQVCKYDAIILK
jgi:indolepyruvate ferredoxin oxidoreductase, alpha subunit